MNSIIIDDIQVSEEKKRELCIGGNCSFTRPTPSSRVRRWWILRGRMVEAAFHPLDP